MVFHGSLSSSWFNSPLIAAFVFLCSSSSSLYIHHVLPESKSALRSCTISGAITAATLTWTRALFLAALYNHGFVYFKADIISPFYTKLHLRACSTCPFDRHSLYRDSWTLLLGMDFEKLLCVCGRSFAQPSALKKHQRSCNKSKKRLAGALAKAKELWTARKRRRIDDSTCPNTTQSESQEGAMISYLGTGYTPEIELQADVLTEIQVGLHTSFRKRQTYRAQSMVCCCFLAPSHSPQFDHPNPRNK